jgi:sugar phosphate isomerase/epimerase
MSLNPRLSLSAICSYPLTFEEDLALWDDIGIRHVGLFYAKLDAFGHARAIDALRKRGMRTSCVVVAAFNLGHPDSWDETRAIYHRCIETAAALGGCVYGATGRAGIGEWDRQVEAFQRAVQPCLDFARARGVRVAFEPSTRPQVSFVHNLHDAIEIMNRTGVEIIVDVGNCWVERDIYAAITHLRERIALVQLSDFPMSSTLGPGMGRVLPGLGDLPLERFIQAAADAGYAGPFEIEYLGLDKNCGDAIRRSVIHTSRVLDGVLGSS